MYIYINIEKVPHDVLYHSDFFYTEIVQIHLKHNKPQHMVTFVESNSW